MKLKLLLILFLASLLNSKELANHLALESSPYLKQHLFNPVDWYPWGKEALQKAKEQRMPIFLSIGYSTCHWCHVMKRESFEDREIAKLLNENFISIKVDREELPHIDAYYQELYRKIYGRSAGWPLSVFMTPDREVLFITGYIPPTKESYSEGFTALITKLSKLAHDKKASMKRVQEIAYQIEHKEQNKVKKDISLGSFITAIKESYDEIDSGFGSGRKFPEAAKLSLMLELSQLSGDKELEEYAYEMLDNMALRGLYDHIEGGFFRYCVDSSWEIPHFEKMLYNQAELIKLYTKAYLLTKKELYKQVVQETIAMLEKRFVKESLYYSASDAQSDAKEGSYFIFSSAEIEKAVDGLKEKEAIKELLNYTPYGNFNSYTHINLSTQKRVDGFDTFKKRLLKIRQKRAYPFIDKKINTAWNGMMIEALYSASSIDKRYINKANQHLKALQKMLFKEGELYHQGMIGKEITQRGLLEDYSFLIAALLRGYEITFDKEKLAFAEYLLNRAQEKFYKDGIWYLNETGMRVRAGVEDKYYTAAVSKMVQNYLNLASLKGNFRYEKVAKRSIESLESVLEFKGIDAPALITASLMQNYGIVVIKSAKENLTKERLTLYASRYPYLLLKKAPYKDFLACTLRRCFAKDSDINKIRESIEAYKYQR